MRGLKGHVEVPTGAKKSPHPGDGRQGTDRRSSPRASASFIRKLSPSVIGLYVSFYLNLASGASIVLVETLWFAVALVLGPRTGLLSRVQPAGSSA